MRNEIGSEFWDVTVSNIENNIFPDNTQWFISGRSALRAIIAENSFGSIAIPFWCCESMILPFVEKGIRVVFYQQDLPDTDAALVMDYFGYVNKNNISEYRGTVIRDLTHSIFSKQYSDAHYYFGSLRKWDGFWTGGFAWGFKKNVNYDASNKAYVDLRKQAMQNKQMYISETISSKEYLNIFSQAEALLDTIGIAPAADRDIESARKFDIDKVRNIRRKNASILINELENITIYPRLGDDDCPLFVPVSIENRNEIRQRLIEKEIYCPVHWPISEYHSVTVSERLLYDRELSLVCDQRYTENDMLRIVEVLKGNYNA